jgi:hypothetical protein
MLWESERSNAMIVLMALGNGDNSASRRVEILDPEVRISVICAESLHS